MRTFHVPQQLSGTRFSPADVTLVQLQTNEVLDRCVAVCVLLCCVCCCVLCVAVCCVSVLQEPPVFTWSVLASELLSCSCLRSQLCSSQPDSNSHSFTVPS